MNGTFSRDQILSGYNIVPNGLWTIPVSTGARVLLGWLHSHSDPFLAQLTVNKCRRIMGTSRIGVYLDELEALGYVQIIRAANGSPSRFHLAGAPWLALSTRPSRDRIGCDRDRSHMGSVTGPISARVEQPSLEQPFEKDHLTDPVGEHPEPVCFCFPRRKGGQPCPVHTKVQA